MKTINVQNSNYGVDEVAALVGYHPVRFERKDNGTSFIFSDSVPDQNIQSAQDDIANGKGIYTFRGAKVRNSIDVDNKVSADIKEAIAPGRPANLQSEAEKALLAKIGALSAKASLGIALTADEQAYLVEKLTFYSSTVQAIRDEGNAFIAARGW